MPMRFRVIADESRVVTAWLYSRYGTKMQEFDKTLPAGRTVGDWPCAVMAKRHVKKNRKMFKQMFHVEPYEARADGRFRQQ